MAQGLPWREGDNLVVDDQEHPSNALPWLSLRRRGVDVRVASSGGHRYTVDDIWRAWMRARGWSRCPGCSTPRACAATSRSWAELRARDIWLVVDGIQGAGLLRARVDDWGVDAFACGAHKGLLGPLGVGFLHLSPALLDALDPPHLAVRRPVAGQVRTRVARRRARPPGRAAAGDRQSELPRHRRLGRGAGPDRAGRPGAHRALGAGIVARAGRRPARPGPGRGVAGRRVHAQHHHGAAPARSGGRAGPSGRSRRGGQHCGVWLRAPVIGRL